MTMWKKKRQRQLSEEEKSKKLIFVSMCFSFRIQSFSADMKFMDVLVIASTTAIEASSEKEKAWKKYTTATAEKKNDRNMCVTHIRWDGSEEAANGRAIVVWWFCRVVDPAWARRGFEINAQTFALSHSVINEVWRRKWKGKNIENKNVSLAERLARRKEKLFLFDLIQLKSFLLSLLHTNRFYTETGAMWPMWNLMRFVGVIVC